MVRIIDAANYLFNEYKSISGGSLLDEMKLHKLLYLAQRESLAISGRPLFYESFEGWKFGPVSPDVRKVYSNSGIQAITNDVSPEASIILNAGARNIYRWSMTTPICAGWEANPTWGSGRPTSTAAFPRTRRSASKARSAERFRSSIR